MSHVLSRTVYLDTAILLDVKDGRISQELLTQLQQVSAIRAVFSASHYDDVVAAGNDDIGFIMKTLNDWPGRLWIVAPSSIPSIETQRFVARGPDDWVSQDHELLNEDLTALAHQYPDIFEFRDALGADISTLRPTLETRTEQKGQWAMAQDASKKASAMGAKKSRTVPNWDAFLQCAPGEGDPLLEREWALSRSKQQTQLSDATSGNVEALLDLDDAAILPVAQAMADTSMLDLKTSLETTRLLRRQLTAFLADDRPTLRAISIEMQAYATRMQAVGDPLGLGMNTKKHFLFRCFMTWVTNEQRDELMGNPGVLRNVFNAWTKCSDGLRGAIVVRETAWLMHHDSQAREVPSNQTDLDHLGALPYVDEIFVDKRIYEKLRQAKAEFPPGLFERVRLNADFEEWANLVLSNHAAKT